ncbi:MAG: tetratricopeptide repeat protein [Magnetococcales bacterium]|nr:tetratricopeptide repeat protein [Magnetococcales bacterium]
MENEQRDAIVEGLSEANNHDLILVSDLDEILSHATMSNLERMVDTIAPVVAPTTLFHSYFLDYKVVEPEIMKNAPNVCICRKKDMTTPQDLRMRAFNHKIPAVLNCGYHFSYLGGVDAVVRKIKSFAHSEYDNDRLRNPHYVASAIRSGFNDYYWTRIRFERYDIGEDPNYPAWIKQNRQRYRHLFYSDEAFNLTPELVQESVRCYTRRLDDDPQDLDAMIQLGMLYLGQGQLERAEHYYRLATTADPTNGAVWNNLAMILEKQGRFSDAISVYNNAVEIGSNNVHIWFNLASLYYRIDRRDDAISCYRKILTIANDSVEALCRLGFVLGQQGHINESIEYLEKALTHQPEHAETRGYLATLRDMMTQKISIINRMLEV